jgi:hypothetical protein
MAISFAKKANSAKPAADDTGTSSPSDSASKTHSPPPKQDGPPKNLAWMKKGSAAKAALAHEEAKAEQKKADRGKMFRFWMPADSSREFTFCDGELDADGMLDVLMYYEHNVKLNGNWEQFVCTNEAEGHCVICDLGEYDPALVGVMTGIDHSSHTIKKGPNAGKEIKNTRKLLVAKRESLKMLTKHAAKRGGLTGCTFDVSRGNDKTASIGNQYDFTSKASMTEVAAKYGLKPEEVAPADYNSEITFLSNEQLLELGIGKKPGGIGYEKGAGKDLKSQL